MSESQDCAHVNSKRYELDMRRREGVKMGVGETGEGKRSDDIWREKEELKIKINKKANNNILYEGLSLGCKKRVSKYQSSYFKPNKS